MTSRQVRRLVFVITTAVLTAMSVAAADLRDPTGKALFGRTYSEMAQANDAHASGISGKWHFVFQTEGGERESTATFQQDGEKVTGKWGKADVQGTFADSKLDLAFPYTSEEGGMTGTLKIQGKLDGEKLVGNWEFEEYNGSFEAARAQ
jgi:hypothetical protein